jgi:hypothetical protein
MFDIRILLMFGQKEAHDTMHLMKLLPIDVYHELVEALLD